MKNQLFLALSTCLILSACQQQPISDCPTAPLVPKFMGQTFLAGQANTYVADFGKPILEQLVLPVVKKAKDGSITVFDPLGDPWTEATQLKLTKAELDRIFAPYIDTLYIEKSTPPYNIEMVVNVDDGLDRIVAIRTYETWQLGDSFKLTKNVSAYTVISENLDPKTGKLRGLEPKFRVAGEFDPTTKKKIATVRSTQQVVNSDHYGDWYRFNLEHSVREHLFGQVLAAADSNSIAFYDEPDVNSKLDAKELKQKMASVDTVYIESPVPPFGLLKTVVEEKVYWDQISEIEFVQDLYMDANFHLFYDVKWYAPRVQMIDRMTGKVIGMETLFWVKCF